MTPAQLEQMAREAGFGNQFPTQAMMDMFARFAKLIRAQALEEAAQACDDLSRSYSREGLYALATCAISIRLLAKQEGGETP